MKSEVNIMEPPQSNFKAAAIDWMQLRPREARLSLNLSFFYKCIASRRQ